MRTTLIILLLQSFILFGYSQSDSSDIPSNPFATEKGITTAYKPAPNWLRHHQRLHSGYYGFFIELKQTLEPMTRTDNTLKLFGVIHYDELPDGRYSYGIKADFDRKDSFRKYVREVVVPKNEDVRLFKYRYGKRREIRFRK